MSKMIKYMYLVFWDKGEGIIKRRKAFALLLALSIAVLIFPSVEGAENQIASSNNVKIGLNEDNILKVNAAASLIVIKTNKKFTYKKVKVKVKVKVRYKYKGKWRVKYVYKYKYVYKRVSTQVKTSKTALTSGSTQININATSLSTITASGKCSCSLYTDYNVHTGTWLNYCPYCRKYGTLVYDKPSDCPEGMIRCTCCDADFCIVHGKEHINTNPKFLTPA